MPGDEEYSIAADPKVAYRASHSRDKLEEYISDYNMMLAGFDAKKVNTLYVDKSLKHHGLIRAYSRTNRILGEQKSQGNILAFRNPLL